MSLAGSKAHTRRSFIGGAVAAGAAHTFAAPLVGARANSREKPCAPEDPGTRTGAIAVAPDRRTVWTADTGATTITAHRARDFARGRSIDVGGAPLGISISPSGDLALVTTAYWDRPGLAIVDLHTGQADRLEVGPEPYSVAFARNGRVAYIAGGGPEGTLTRLNTRSWSVEDTLELGSHPRGLAVCLDGEHGLVALGGDAAVALVSLAPCRVVRRIATAPYPYLLAVSPDGRRALATHNGFAASAVTPLDLVRWRARRRVAVGADPSGVAFSESGALALVAATGSRTVAVLDGRSSRLRRTVRHGGAPRSVAVAGRRGIVADGGTGRLTAIRLGAGR